MAEPGNYFAIQQAFTGGELSEDVGSRTDLDKYAMGLLQAENAVIRPYGAVRKRQGFKYCKYSFVGDWGKIRLYPFHFTTDLAYLLIFYKEHIAVYRKGKKVASISSAPYTADEIASLKFVQSIDVLYICSGTHPVMKLERYGDTDWRLEEIDWTHPAFDDVNKDDTLKIYPSYTTGSNVKLTATGDVFTADRVGDFIQLDQYITGTNVDLNATTTGSTTTMPVNAPAEGTAKLTLTAGSASQVTLQVQKMVTSYYGYGSGRTYADWTSSVSLSNPSVGASASGTYSGALSVRIYAQGATSGTRVALSLTSTDGTDTREYSFAIDSSTTSSAINVGDTWKILTHGTWAGTVKIQMSQDAGATWVDLRTYTGNEDYNPTESGSVDEKCLLRVKATITSGTCKINLSSYPYTWTGMAKVTAVTDAKTATVTVLEDFGDTSATADWYWGAWSKTNGYPRCVTFFQDRLVFGGCKKHPQRLWMSRTGDYENFSVDKESGTVTDDSAIAADLLSLEAYEIKHMVPGNDLLIFTEGNAWSISGAETVKPTSITPRVQESYGVSDVPPIHIGARTIYVQRRGSTVRDTGYSYQTDSYLGSDLTLLAKHLVQGHTIVDATYAQEPDSILYFVRDDGVLLCMTYVSEQNVYAWSHFVTDGQFESVAAVNEGGKDAVYAIVRRDTTWSDGTPKVQYILEVLDDDHSDSELQQDYVMLDCATTQTSGTATNEVSGLDVLDGREAAALGDGYYFDHLKVKNGRVTLPVAVKSVTVGLPYKMVLEQPNFDVGLTQDGTLQGRTKSVSQATLRLRNSFGGWIGADKEHLSEIRYRIGKMELVESTIGENHVLYSGDLLATLTLGGYNTKGRVYIEHASPYPFHLSAIIRRVSIGG